MSSRSCVTSRRARRNYAPTNRREEPYEGDQAADIAEHDATRELEAGGTVPVTRWEYGDEILLGVTSSARGGVTETGELVRTTTQEYAAHEAMRVEQAKTGIQVTTTAATMGMGIATSMVINGVVTVATHENPMSVEAATEVGLTLAFAKLGTAVGETLSGMYKTAVNVGRANLTKAVFTAETTVLRVSAAIEATASGAAAGAKQVVQNILQEAEPTENVGMTVVFGAGTKAATDKAKDIGQGVGTHIGKQRAEQMKAGPEAPERWANATKNTAEALARTASSLVKSWFKQQ